MDTPWTTSVLNILWPEIWKAMKASPENAYIGSVTGAVVGTAAFFTELMVEALGFEVALTGPTALAYLNSLGVSGLTASSAPAVLLVGGCIAFGAILGGAYTVIRSGVSIVKAFAACLQRGRELAKTPEQKEAWNAEVQKWQDILEKAKFGPNGK